MCCDERVNIDTDPVRLRAVAEQLASEAAEFVGRRRTEVFGAGSAPDGEAQSAVRAKSSPTDPVTVVDTETERLLRDRLAERRPGDAILGEEEGGSVDVADGRLTWVLDPIDGTVNFLYGIPAYAVSVGVRRDGVSVAGAVADVAAGAVYSAALGHGAGVRRGGVLTPLRCTAATDLSMALVGTGFSYEREHRQRQGEIAARLLPDVRDVRRMGSCALDLCAVAAGRLDAYYEDDVHLWDWAAAALIATEAGAHVRPPATGDGAGLMVAAAPGISAAFDAALIRCGAVGG
ncbi:inositol monophosphatase family protein [Mycolicibacterium austroafricanum]|uniref:inositol monophosphatase family protein n=1 Tax=Mycolicibacterium austroafricanum TaxID=39687 RepID=UPI001CA37D26|nr:inositol monophosphatase family protein [Mycolicibacterium austroafricanum]QZT65513.1 inositol monophosphatase [Mycolicibacterium austroafricanum]